MEQEGPVWVKEEKEKNFSVVMIIQERELYSSARVIPPRRGVLCGVDMSSSSYRLVEHFVDGEHPMYACLGYTGQIGNPACWKE